MKALELPEFGEGTRLNDISQAEKERTITQACEEHNLDELVRLADSAGGLLNDKLRCAACKHHATLSDAA